jgi:2-dehydro-3-deoxygluconokinase
MLMFASGMKKMQKTTLGFKAKGTDVTKGELNLDGYKDVFQADEGEIQF